MPEAPEKASELLLPRRPKDELLERPLSRLQKTAVPPQPDRRQKRQKGGPPPPPAEADSPVAVAVALHAGPSLDDPLLDPATTTNEAAWKHGRLLRIGDATYTVEVNPPILDRVELFARPFVGIPLAPTLQVCTTKKGLLLCHVMAPAVPLLGCELLLAFSWSATLGS